MSRKFQLSFFVLLACWGVFLLAKAQDSRPLAVVENEENKTVSQPVLTRIESRFESLVQHCRQFASPYRWTLSKSTEEQKPLATLSMADIDGAFESPPRIDFIYRQEQEVWIPHAISWNDAASLDWVEMNVNKLCDIAFIEEEFRILMLFGI